MASVCARTVSLARTSRSREGGHEALVAVRDRRVQDGREDALAARPAASQARHGGIRVDAHANAQLLLALAAVDRQHAVVGDLVRGLGEVVVGLVGALLVGVHGNGDDVGRVLGEGAQVGDVLGVLGHRLCHDVGCAGKRLLGRVEPGLRRLGRHEGRRGVERRSLGRDLHEDHVGERLEPRLARLLRARHALLAIGLVEVLDALHDRGGANLLLELGRELALRLDEQQDVRLALLEVAQVGEALVERAQGDVVHATRGLLAVARDEGDGVALVDELDGRLDGFRLEAELVGERGDDIHVWLPRSGAWVR